MRGFSRTVQLALAIISTFASDITFASTPEEMATAYFQAIGGRDTQSLPEPIKSRTIRQIKKLSDPRVSELAPGILSNFTSSITNIFTKQELWDEYQKFVEIAKSLPEPINGETVLALARIWYPKSISESVRHSFGKKLMSNQKPQINFLQKLARCNNISIFKIRKDRKGYTKTPLTIPQLKSRLTRHGISYKINKFGMTNEEERAYVAWWEEAERAAARVADRYERASERRRRMEAARMEEEREVGAEAARAARAARHAAAWAAARAARAARAEAARTEVTGPEARWPRALRQATGRGGSRDLEDTAPTGDSDGVIETDEDFDPFSVFDFGKKRKKSSFQN